MKGRRAEGIREETEKRRNDKRNKKRTSKSVGIIYFKIIDNLNYMKIYHYLYFTVFYLRCIKLLGKTQCSFIKTPSA